LLSLKSVVTSPNDVEGPCTGIQEFDKSKWIDVRAAVSIRLLGKRAEIEVVSPLDGIRIGAHWLPVIGIAYDPAKDELKIMLDGVDHVVFNRWRCNSISGSAAFKVSVFSTRTMHGRSCCCEIP
jgi:hypothetical protein